jgi:dynein heavy chain
MVRHGLMMVGDSMSGKSTIIECLKEAMCKLAGMEEFNKVEVNKLNPKSIMSFQLYGLFDNDTKQWTDGVLPKIMRGLAT